LNTGKVPGPQAVDAATPWTSTRLRPLPFTYLRSVEPEKDAEEGAREDCDRQRVVDATADARHGVSHLVEETHPHTQKSLHPLRSNEADWKQRVSCFSSLVCTRCECFCAWTLCAAWPETIMAYGSDEAVPPPMEEEDLQKIYNWIDEIPLTRPKRNISRDFSDGGACNRSVRDCVRRGRRPVATRWGARQTAPTNDSELLRPGRAGTAL